MSMNKFRLALLQLAVNSNKAENLEKTSRKIREAASEGAKMVVLPECFGFPNAAPNFPKYAETIPGESSEMMSRSAKENQVYLIGGSMSESDNGKIYSTCLVYGPDGSMLAKHRKIHLFGFNIPGKIRFSETDFITSGNRLTTFNTPFCKVGVGVCFDMCFAYMAEAYGQLGCKLLVYPGAFDTITGPTYWEVIQRTRAIDNQVYVATASPSRDESASYVNWGHSMLVDPSGTVVQSAGSGEELVLADVDLDQIDEAANKFPINKEKKNDIYNLVINKGLGTIVVSS
ncbi:omega-amidase NIT2-like [Ixodes scapularis]|uniref:omega-amidase NIT2-like n=1 Tax=Ixodes scapularis TaxID=6945 RepID=UPI001A9D8BED|nr:omega-amidase NIT2-like [Ixodes scapularis]